MPVTPEIWNPAEWKSGTVFTIYWPDTPPWHGCTIGRLSKGRKSIPYGYPAYDGADAQSRRFPVAEFAAQVQARTIVREAGKMPIGKSWKTTPSVD